MRGALLAAALASAILFAGCAEIDLEGDEGSYDGPVNQCARDDDCARGTCHDDLSVCAVQAPVDAQDLYVKVIPPATTGAAVQVFEVDLAADGRVVTPLDVKVPVVLSAKTLAGEEAPSHLQATVIFTHEGNRLPGRPPVLTVYESNGAVFELSLTPGVYGIMAIPGGGVNGQAGAFPVHYMDDVTVDSTGVMHDSSGASVDLIVPAAGSWFEGVVRQGGLPVNGLEVTAVDPQTGRIVSTITETACDLEGLSCGRFRLGIAPGVETFSLKISRRFESHHPVFQLDGYTAAKDGETLHADVALAPLGVPVRYLAEVERPVAGLDGVAFDDPAPGSFVLFESSDVAGGTVEKWVSTNESGALEEIEGLPGVNLYPGDYMVTVIPAVASFDSSVDFAALVSPEPISIEGATEVGGQVFSLERRPRVDGFVGAEGIGVPGCTITAEPVGSFATVRRSKSYAGQDGAFEMWMDEGDYVVVVEAPAPSRYAWGMSATTATDGASLDLDLPVPFVAYGEVVPSMDQVDPVELGGTVLEWYRIRDGVAYGIGRVVADTEGSFTALLAP